MSWMERSKEEQRWKFVDELASGLWSVTDGVRRNSYRCSDIFISTALRDESVDIPDLVIDGLETKLSERSGELIAQVL
jgi:hypothetical protein